MQSLVAPFAHQLFNRKFVDPNSDDPSWTFDTSGLLQCALKCILARGSLIAGNDLREGNVDTLRRRAEQVASPENWLLSDKSFCFFFDFLKKIA